MDARYDRHSVSTYETFSTFPTIRWPARNPTTWRVLEPCQADSWRDGPLADFQIKGTFWPWAIDFANDKGVLNAEKPIISLLLVLNTVTLGE